MRDHIEISCTPSGEDCEQLGPGYRPDRARYECSVFIRQLRRMFGDEPGSARLYIASNAHDFGTYYEVACRFDDADEEAMDYAFRCENDMPEYWDDEARAELGLGLTPAA